MRCEKKGRKEIADVLSREVCDWDAELVCPLAYNRNRIIWTREHDAYYPRDKYRDIFDYCGGRCDPDGELLRIRNVQPEDKGVYRLVGLISQLLHCDVQVLH